MRFTDGNGRCNQACHTSDGTIVATIQEERSDSPSLLLMISDRDAMDASARSAHRRVYRWSERRPDDPVGPHGNVSAFLGDPTKSETFQWVADARSVTAVVHLSDDDRSAAVVEALRKVRGDAAIMVLSRAIDRVSGDGTLIRAGELRDVLRLDLEDELLRLEAERRTWCLREFAGGPSGLAIYIHPDPDPDALSSALAVRDLLGAEYKAVPIVTELMMRRPENVRMAALLEVDVQVVTVADLQRYERVIVVDTQPSPRMTGPRLAVIDHHPATSDYAAAYVDVRPEYGAVATMMTEYLRAVDEHVIDARLATALLCGIITDTASLTRGVTAADVNAFAFLQGRADPVLLRRIRRASYPVDAARAFGGAIDGLHLEDGLAVAFAGELTDTHSHILADLADFCMEISDVSRTAASAVVDDKLVIALRDLGQGDGVTGIATRLGELGGNGGGHATMARAVVPLAALPDWHADRAVSIVRDLVRNAMADSVNPPSEEQVSRRS